MIAFTTAIAAVKVRSPSTRAKRKDTSGNSMSVIFSVTYVVGYEVLLI